jgi:hypothetical protein
MDSPSSSLSDAALCVPPPLVHIDPAASDEVRRKEAADHLARWPALQLLGEILVVLRAAGVSWWAPGALCARWPLSERLRWLEQRPDVRDEVTKALAGVALRDGRRRTAAFQAELIEARVDVAADAARLEEAFDPRDLVVYGPARALWGEVMACIPWDGEVSTVLLERLLTALLADRTHPRDAGRASILTPWQVRNSIDTRSWQAHVPLRLRAAVDDARLHKELVDPAAPFTARDEMAIVTPAILAANLPLRALRPVFVAAERVMGLEPIAPAQSQPAPKGGLPEAANDSDGDTEVTVSIA